MRTLLFVLTIISFLLSQCTAKVGEQSGENKTTNVKLPRVLFITSGISDQNPVLEKGAVIAVQSSNKRGVPVRFEARDVLYDLKKLNEYEIMVLSTFPGYHDADRNHATTQHFEKKNAR